MSGCVCERERQKVCVFSCMFMRGKYVCVCVYACVHVLVHVLMYTPTHKIHIHTHTHTHTLTLTHTHTKRQTASHTQTPDSDTDSDTDAERCREMRRDEKRENKARERTRREREQGLVLALALFSLFSLLPSRLSRHAAIRGATRRYQKHVSHSYEKHAHQCQASHAPNQMRTPTSCAGPSRLIMTLSLNYKTRREVHKTHLPKGLHTERREKLNYQHLPLKNPELAPSKKPDSHAQTRRRRHRRLRQDRLGLLQVPWQAYR